jgi:DNA-binding CsgD family transcriptional regulator
MVEPAVEIGAELGDLTPLAFALAPASQAAIGCGDPLAYDALLRRTLEEATESGVHLPAVLAAVSLALQEVSAGRPEACRAILHEHRAGESEGLILAFMYDIVAAMAAIALGDWPAARREAQSAIEYARTIDSPSYLAAGKMADAMALRYGGDLRAAESVAFEALQAGAGAEAMQFLLPALDLIAGIALEDERYIEGVRISAACAAIRERTGAAVSEFELALRAAVLESPRRAIGEEAVTLAWEEGSRLDVAETLEYVMRARGERKRPSAGWESLTPRELAVVQLAAQGLTNPEIAEKLFVGRGTVKTHLASIFTKVGVRTRTELAAEAARRDLSANDDAR